MMDKMQIQSNISFLEKNNEKLTIENKNLLSKYHLLEIENQQIKQNKIVNLNSNIHFDYNEMIFHSLDSKNETTKVKNPFAFYELSNKVSQKNNVKSGRANYFSLFVPFASRGKISFALIDSNDNAVDFLLKNPEITNQSKFIFNCIYII